MTVIPVTLIPLCTSVARRAGVALACAFALTLVFALTLTGAPREVLVTTPAELTAALAAARAGDTIVLKDGDWKDLVIDFNSSGGTADAPITLRAQTPGQARLTGASRLTFSTPHLVVEGLFFTSGASPGEAVVEFRSHHGRFTESAIVDYNPSNPDTGYAWVTFFGSDNRVDHSTFRGKSNDRPVVTNRGPGYRRNRVDHSYFKDIRHVPKNGREVIQIMGYGMSEERGEDGAFFVVERNLFDEAHGEGMEIISIKSNRNVIRDNTFRKTKGGITNRSGNFNTIERNIILGEREPGSYGIRVTGHGQTVIDNYVADVGGSCLLLVAGEHIDAPLTPAYQPIAREGTPLGRVPRYAQVTDGLFARNTLVDCGEAAVEIGSSYRAGWPQAQRVLLPERNRIIDNVIRQSNGIAAITVTAPDRTAPLDAFTFAANVFTGTIAFGGAVADAAATDVRRVDPLLTKSGALWRPSAKSPAMKGPARDGVPSLSAAPLSPADVGPAWVKASRQSDAARAR